jgi:hypothetical protein
LPPSVTAPAAALAGVPRPVVAGNPAASRWLAALTGCRVLYALDFPMPPEFLLRVQLGERLARGDLSALPDAARYGVTHLVVTSAELTTFGLSLDDLGNRPYLTPLVVARDGDGSYVALYALRAAPA